MNRRRIVQWVGLALIALAGTAIHAGATTKRVEGKPACACCGSACSCPACSCDESKPAEGCACCGAGSCCSSKSL